MEGNVCDVNHLDSDVLLPPRKRLLACLKKQNSNVNGNPNSDSPSLCNSFNELDNRINYLLKAHLSNDNPSQEEIVAASRAAAEAAVTVAMAKRALAQEKALIAAKAMAAAKKALELVATIDDDDDDQDLSKNKSKKQVEVETLYNNKKPRLENGKTNDEEVARKLHQAINSSPRISKGSVPKKVKISNISEKNGRIIVGEENSKEIKNITKSNMENRSKEKCGDEDITILGRKRGRMKQKKLPLSICHDRDQATLKEDTSSTSPLFVGPTNSRVVERDSLWKCKAFKAHACLKQNKVMQS